MKECNRCLTENQDEAVFCSGCGAKLEDQLNEVSEVSMSDRIMTPDLDVKRPKKSKKGILVAFILIFVVLASVVGVQAYTRFNPIARLTYGLAQMSKQNELSTKISFATNVEPTIDEFFKVISFNSEVYTNRKENFSHIAYNFSHEDEPLISFVMAAELDTLFIDLPGIFKENDYLYYPISEEVETLKPEDYEKYMKMVDWKSMPIKAYAELLDEMLKESAENNFSSTTFSLTGEDFIDLLDAYLELLDDDDALVLWTQENIVNVLEAMLEDEFYVSGMTEEDLEMFLNEIDSRSFIDDYRDVLEDMISEFDLVKRELKTQARVLKFEMVVEYSLFNKITKMIITPSYDDMSMTLEMDYTVNLKPVKTYDAKLGRNMEDLESEAINQIATDVITHIKQKIESKSTLESYLNGLVQPLYIDSIYTLLDEMNNMINYQLDGAFDASWSDSDFDFDSVDSTNSDPINVGMVTTTSGIVDGSYAEEAWNGLVQYYEYWGDVNNSYLVASTDTTEHYLTLIAQLVDSGNQVIILPGSSFEVATYLAQDMYPEIKFILIDGEPHSEDFSAYYIAPNTQAIFFNEHEAGFLAGVAAAIQVQTGKIAFIGGMEIPIVERYGYGYWAGMDYANKNFDTNVTMEDFVYVGDFNDATEMQRVASDLYDADVKVIMHAAGSSAMGLYEEAIKRNKANQTVYVIGVETDEYDLGLLNGSIDDPSVTLTSAIKRYDLAIDNALNAIIGDYFYGGDVLFMTLDDGAVGLPYYNPNLSYEITDLVYEAELAVYYGEVFVPETYDALQDFLATE